MKKILLILATLIIFPLFLQAGNLDIPITCPGGGTLLITGDYNPINGSTNVNLVLDNCGMNDGNSTRTISGTATLSGTLVVNGNINLNLDFENVNYVENDQEESINQTCSGTITFIGTNSAGNTNLLTNSSLNCDGNGTLKINFNKFINSLIFLDVF